MGQDLYSVLGVSKDADDTTIKKAYRALARDLHPDRHPGDAKAEARFKAVNQAFEVLSKPERRAAYDEFGELALRDGFDANQARQARAWQGHGGGGGGVSFEDLFGGRVGNYGNVQGGADFDMFAEMFGGAGARRRGPRKGQDLEGSVRVSFLDAARGATLEVSPRGTPVSVRLPAGARDGSKVRIAGQGMPSSSGGPPGDLLLSIHVEPHPLLRREEDDLHLDVPITLSEAYFGGKVRVPTLEGGVMLKVPQGTQSGAVVRVPGKGIARKGKPAGNLYVHFQVHVPTQRSAELDALMEKLGPLQSEDVREKLVL